MPWVLFKIPRVFFQVFRGVSRREGGALGPRFFALHLTLGGKVDIHAREDLFFALLLILNGKPT